MIASEEFNTSYFNDSMEKVILGEAATLSTFILKNNQRLTKTNYAQLSRMASLIIEYEDETEWDDESIPVDPLLKNLILLRSRLNQEKVSSLNINLIKPFCDVIVNKDVSGPVTGLALQSIQKFLNYGFIKDNEVVKFIGESVTNARFVGTDSNGDEAVLMTILNVLESLIVMPFYSLTNGIICEIMQSCFRIAFESRLSELLRKSAVKSLTEMVRALFNRISTFDKESSNYNYFYQDKNNASFYKLNRMGKRFVGHNKHKKIENKQQSANKINKEDNLDFDSNQKTYGLACIHELLSYLTSLINPLPDGQNTEYMIAVGLQLLTVIFEISVNEIGTNYCLLSVVKTDLCWNIMQLLQMEKNLNTFSSVLRLAFLLFADLRMHLKFQFETFLLRIMDIIATVNTPLEYRDICIEYLLQFFRHIPYLPHELFFNYDCNQYSSNILEDLLQLLSKNCFTNGTNNTNNQNDSSLNLNFTTLQILSFEVLLSNLKSLQLAELYKEKEIYLTANPATMIVNIRDVFNEKKFIDDLHFNICSSVSSNIDNNSNSEINTSNDSNQIETFVPELNNVEPINTSDNNNNNNNNGNNDQNNEIKEQIMEQNMAPVINKYCVTYLFPKSSLNLIQNEQIEAMKQRKSLLWIATEKFNKKPSNGIQYLYENRLVQNDDDVVEFFRNNSKLDKKSLGEYLSSKKNINVLSKFVESFTFKDTRIDDALRLYLESFRLPGEAPLISLVLEQFAHHWHESNSCPFVNEDAAFSLAYAIIMLNVDQHNLNVKRQTNPMTCEEFISNLRQVNGGKDFDRNMLTEIYTMIKNNEIIMPAEQQGVVREKYLWKCLLKNSETLNGIYWFYNSKDNALEHFKNTKDFNVNLCIFHKSIFEISWSPSISTLTLVFDKLNPAKQRTLSQRVLNNGFTSCSLLCANYGHLDNLIENLSKFVIGSPRITKKSELVAYCLFNVCKEYANEMRFSWKNIIELILFWYDNKLLDNSLEIDDFAMDSKKIRFTRKVPFKSPKQINENNQSTFFSSFYSYFSSNPTMIDDNNGLNVNNNNNSHNNNNNNDNNNNSGDDFQANKPPIMNNNGYCQMLVLIIEESKFLHIDSLIELIKALIQVQHCDTFDDDIEVFKIEILLKVILMNRDRLSIFWDLIYKHIIKLMKFCFNSEYLTERIISTIFRLAIRFTSRPGIVKDQIFLLLYQMLLAFYPEMLQRNSTALTLHSFISQCNCYFIQNEQWELVFNLILAISIGYYPSNKKLHIESPDTNQKLLETDPSNINHGHILSTSINDLSKLSGNLLSRKNISDDIFTFNYVYRILDAEAYEKCVDIMALIIKEYLPNIAKTFPKADSNVYEISQMTVGVLCKLVEASIKIQFATARSPNLANHNKNYKLGNKSRLSRLTNAILSSSESDSDDEQRQNLEPVKTEITSVTENVALKLLDLMHYFHLYAPTIFNSEIDSDLLWNTIWCPLLQATAFFCCDSRRPVRTCAFTFLQRTLLLHDLQVLNAVQWESCFNKVLFPLLSKLLEPINMCDPIGMDETRMRTTNLLCKVFLQHLNPLLTLNTFTALWLTILDFMDKYIKADMKNELVKEAIPESLKNTLLVMNTAGCFNETLNSITWDRINVFLPDLYKELMPQTLPPTIQPAETVNAVPAEPVPVPVTSDEKQLAEPSPENAIKEESEEKTSISTAESNNATESNNPVPQYPSYNLPSTFIDMESIYSEAAAGDSNIQKSLNFVSSQQYLPTNVVYPGSIAQYYTNTNTNDLMANNYSSFDTKHSLLPPGKICKIPATVNNTNSQSYPWPMPNLNENGSTSYTNQ